MTPDLLVGGYLGLGDVDALAALGVGGVVNVSHELIDPSASLAALSIDYLRVPCWDTRAPAPSDAERGVAFIDATITSGRPVYVHCASGVGRSVTLSLCYLATSGGLELDAALEKVQRGRPRVSMSSQQLRFVEDYVASHRARAGSVGPPRRR